MPPDDPQLELDRPLDTPDHTADLLVGVAFQLPESDLTQVLGEGLEPLLELFLEDQDVVRSRLRSIHPLEDPAGKRPVNTLFGPARHLPADVSTARLVMVR